MSKQPKYFNVLLHLYDKKMKGKDFVHYHQLREVIYDDETIKKYSHSRRNKVVIDYMVCVYMGKLARKDLVSSDYKKKRFMGWSITQLGMDFLKEKELI